MENTEKQSALQTAPAPVAAVLTPASDEHYAAFGQWIDVELAKLEAQWECSFPLRGKTVIPWRQGAIRR
jgi:hypothetical protein